MRYARRCRLIFSPSTTPFRRAKHFSLRRQAELPYRWRAALRHYAPMSRFALDARARLPHELIRCATPPTTMFTRRRATFVALAPRFSPPPPLRSAGLMKRCAPRLTPSAQRRRCFSKCCRLSADMLDAPPLDATPAVRHDSADEDHTPAPAPDFFALRRRRRAKLMRLCRASAAPMRRCRHYAAKRHDMADYAAQPRGALDTPSCAVLFIFAACRAIC